MFENIRVIISELLKKTIIKIDLFSKKKKKI